MVGETIQTRWVDKYGSIWIYDYLGILILPPASGMVVWAAHVSATEDLCTPGVSCGANRCQSATCEAMGF